MLAADALMMALEIEGYHAVAAHSPDHPHRFEENPL
jgi:hypothetical protein